MTTLYYYHKDFLKHDTGLGHPENPDRLSHINAALKATTFDSLKRITPELRPDVNKLIRMVHTKSVMDQVLEKVAADGYISLDADTLLSEGSAHAALLAVSVVCDAIDRIKNKTARNAFCAVRPPGHHAEANRSMGFCLFNNVAIAAEYARQIHSYKRIAIIDFDVHHGNGTQAIFDTNAEVFYTSTHEMPNYPGTGFSSEIGVGNILNVPLASGETGSQFREKFRQKILPAIRQFNPELILLSAGFDAHKDDPLASIQLTESDYAWLTEKIMDIADVCCEGRIVSVLEGGYNLYALADSVSAHVKVLMRDS